MKKLALIIAALMVTTSLQAETLMGTFTGKLRGTDTVDKHILDLKRGMYRYELKLSGDKRARARLRISQKRLSRIKKGLVDVKKLKSRHTHEGTFNIEVRGVAGQNTKGTRETTFKVSKKAGPRKINYTLKIYKK